MGYGNVKISNGINPWESINYKVNSYGGNVIISTEAFAKTTNGKAVLQAGSQRVNITDEQTLYSRNFTHSDYKYDAARYISPHLPLAGDYAYNKEAYLENTHWTDFVDETLQEDGQKYNGNEELSLGQKAYEIFDQIVSYTEKLTKKATDNVILAMNDLSNLYLKFKSGNTGIDGITDVKCDGNAGVYTVTYIDENKKERVLAFDFTTSAEIEAGKKPEVQPYEDIVNNTADVVSKIRMSQAELCDEKNSR